MVPDIFSVACPTYNEPLYICSWNIHAVKNKLENTICLELLAKYDIVVLNEIKTATKFHVPGFNVFLSDNDNQNRGGTALLVKSYLTKYIQWVDTSSQHQVWINFSIYPKLVIGGCYIPPSDSPYFDIDSYSKIQERVMSNKQYEYVVIGDFNARCGQSVNTILDNLTLSNKWSYRNLPDPVGRPNTNGQHVIKLCSNLRLVPINNLCTAIDNTFHSACTFRRKSLWISELDMCMLSVSSVNSVTEFSVNQNINLPSDHAPIVLGLDTKTFRLPCVDNLLYRARELGDHAVLHNVTNSSLSRRPIRYGTINKEEFID